MEERMQKLEKDMDNLTKGCWELYETVKNQCSAIEKLHEGFIMAISILVATNRDKITEETMEEFNKLIDAKKNKET